MRPMTASEKKNKQKYTPFTANKPQLTHHTIYVALIDKANRGRSQTLLLLSLGKCVALNGIGFNQCFH